MKNSFIGILAYMGYINITLLIMYVYVALLYSCIHCSVAGVCCSNQEHQ